MAYTTLNPLVITIDHAAPGAVTATLVRPVKVIDAMAYVTTAAAVATSVQIASAAGNITDDFSLGNNADKKIGRAGTVADANQAIASGADVTSTLTGAGTAARTIITCIDNS